MGNEDEAVEDAAIRELEEETGYRAGRMEKLLDLYSSPGMLSESFVLLRAHELERVGNGGGTDSEDINVHRVPLGELREYVAEWQRAGNAVDVKVAILLGSGLWKDRGMTGRVAGKCALVTGAAQGLGAAQARLLAAEGARVLLTDLERRGRCKRWRVKSTMSTATALPSPSNTMSPARMSGPPPPRPRANSLAGLSILVNNAGIGAGGHIEDCSFADWKRSFAVNVDSAFLGTQKALPLMKESQPGSIVNISSIAGLIASDTMPAYNASKAAIWMLTKSVALYCAKRGWNIRCNSVHPTFVDTPILDGIGSRAGLEKDVVMGKLARQIPLGRVGRPEEIAQGVLYLAS